jgi:single-strand DNA-binding protein
MASINKAIIVGNLGGDPEIRTFDNGGKIANISVATSEKWTDKNTGQPQERTEWHRITFNNRLADIVEQYLRKGSQIYVEGSLHTRKWTDNNGIERYATEIKAHSMQVLGQRQQGQQQAPQGYQQQAPQYPQQAPQARQGQRYANVNGHPMPNQPLPQGKVSDDDVPF